MNAKERRNYIKTNTPRVKTMAAKLKLVDMPRRAERLLEMFASEADWLRAIEITARYEKALPATDYGRDPYQWQTDDMMDTSPFAFGVSANAFFHKVKHGTSKSDRINNLQAAQIARQRAKAKAFGAVPTDVELTRPRVDFGTSTISMADHQLDNLAYSRLILDELTTLIPK